MLSQIGLLLALATIARVQTQLPPSDDSPRLWPQPKQLLLGVDADDLFLGGPDTYSIEFDETDDILVYNTAYYMKEMFKSRPSGDPPSGTLINKLIINVEASSDQTTYPTLGMDESYTLTHSEGKQ